MPFVPSDDLSAAIGKVVKVHLNLHRGDYSISAGGRVIGYAPAVELTDCTMVIDERLQRKFEAYPNRRTVHALIKGRLTGFAESSLSTRVYCDPFKYTGFCTDDHRTVITAREVALHPDRRISAGGVVTRDNCALRAVPLEHTQKASDA